MWTSFVLIERPVRRETVLLLHAGLLMQYSGLYRWYSEHMFWSYRVAAIKIV